MLPIDHLKETHRVSVTPSISDVPADGVVDAPVNTTEAETNSCPPPLGWRQVLRTVQGESSVWTLNRNGDTIRGRTFGQGPPLYFLNGIGGNSDLFALLVWLLREEFRCVLFDYENSSRFPGSGPRRSVDEMAEDLFAVARMQGDKQFSVYATSFGALVALNAMLHQPDRIDRSVLQGGFAHRNLSLFEKMLARICCFVPGSYRRVPLRKKIQCWNHRRWFPPFDITRWQFLVDNTGSLPIATLARRASVLIKSDLRSRLAEIQQPVLLIRSEGEGKVSEGCHRDLELGLMNTQSEFLNNCGHLPYLTHPHRLMKRVLPFLQQKATDSCEVQS
jgi:pimeloyl-ACP methyl ester carboxylesterase